MAAPDRQAPEHLTFLARIAETVSKWGLFPVLRGAEARAPHLPRIGRARLPSQNIVDLGQTATMGFADSTLRKIEIGNGRARVTGPWFGLLGPMGPLPMHLTEFAVYEARYAPGRPFGRFLDLISGRMLQLFYRAWADSQPAALMDRPDDDRFGDQIAALSGAREGAGPAFPAAARLHYAALFASRRSAVAIEDGLSDLLGQRVVIQEYQSRWRDLEPGDRTTLGGAYAQLGGAAMLGGRALCTSDAFRLVVRANSLRDYITLMPRGSRFAVAAEALDAFAPSHLEWDIAVELEERHARPVRLDGKAQLGWTSWMRLPSDSSKIRRDAHLRRATRPAPLDRDAGNRN
jgi:type VI secretion system ImpH/TssG family protein